MRTSIPIEILANYSLVQGHVELEAISNGLINETWVVKNSHQDFILQKVNHHIFKNPDAIAFNVRLIADYLQANFPGYLFVAPFKTRDNEEMKYAAGEGYFRLFPFIKKSVTLKTVQNTQQAYEAAREFGNFTKLLSLFPAKTLQITLPDFHNLVLRYQQFETALESGNEERRKESAGLIHFIKANAGIVDTYKNILQNPAFKLRVTHHDTKISNVLFNEADKGLCVIDLDTVMPGYFISDVGDMMRTYLSAANEEEGDFKKIVIREQYFKAIWDGYMKEMASELSMEEKGHFIYAGKFMIYMQAIRFLADYLNNDVYYGAKYEKQNLVRAGNQVVLLQDLLEKETALLNMIQ